MPQEPSWSGNCWNFCRTNQTAIFINILLVLHAVINMAEKCITCKVSLVNNKGATRFMCPACGKQKIARCGKCREIVAKYKCPECGFEGPN